MTDFNYYLSDQYLVALYCRAPIYTLLETTFQTIPLFWVWLTSLLVWFFLELSVWEAYAKNEKHAYVAELNRQTEFMLSLPAILIQPQFRKNFLKIIIKIYT